jgi:O-antigen/teichoic acid export membrane protein
MVSEVVSRASASGVKSRSLGVSRPIRTIAAVIARASGSVSQLALVAVIGHLAGARAIGSFYVYFSWTVVLGTFVTLGYPTLLLRTFASADSPWPDRRLLSQALRRTALTGGGAAIVLLLLAPWTSGAIGIRGVEGVVPVIGVGVVLYGCLRTVSDALKGLNRPLWGLGIEFVIPVVLAAMGAMIVAGVNGGSISTSAILLMHVAGLLISLSIGLAILSRNIPRHDPAPSAPVAPRGGLWATSVVLAVLPYSPFLVLPHVASPGAVGDFAIAQRAVASATVLLVALSSVFSPAFARLYAAGIRRQLAHELSRSQWWAAGLYLPVLAAILALRFFVAGALGGSPTAAKFILIIGVAQAINALTGLSGDFLLMTEQQSKELTAVVLGAALSVVLAALLGRAFGAIGVAFAFSIALALKNVIEFAAAHRTLEAMKEVVVRG